MWCLALWQYRPPPHVLARNHSPMLLSGVRTNTIGFDLSPGVLAIPLRSGGGRKQLGAGGAGAGDFCWLTQEDLVLYFLNSISVFSHVAARSVSSLGLVRADFLSVRPHKAALSAVPLIRCAIATETAVVVVTGEGHLVGDISPALLSACDETAAAAMATLSVVDLMAYIDYFGSPPELILRAIKTGLKDKGLDAIKTCVPLKFPV